MSRFDMTPGGERIQKIAFVRHGVAKHNVLDPTTSQPPKLNDPKFWDPPLLYQGKQQALEAGERLRTWWHTTQISEEIQIIVTSPLTRCIQTTMLGFLPGERYTDQNRGRKEPVIYCTELVREAFGMHYPDKRRNKTLLQENWAGLTFDANMTEHDDNWKSDQRETVIDVQNRIETFLQELVQRIEANIVVVSHGVWMEVCFHKYCAEALDHGQKRVLNCNIFVGELISKDGSFVRLQNVRQIH